MDNEEHKQMILSEIDKMRSYLVDEPKIRLNTQIEVMKIIDQTVEILEHDSSDMGLQKADSKLITAKKRAQQAINQEKLMPWFPIAVVLYLGGILALLAWLVVTFNVIIFGSELEPQEVMFGVVLWSAVGSVTVGLWDLGVGIARQEVDINRVFWYATHPLTGPALGAILFLVVHGGLLAITENTGSYDPMLLYALAALAGFWQRQVIQFFRNTFETIVHPGKERPGHLI